ncbi:MAG: NAD(P)/FAD-dependent oxidoreductase [Anaerolineae bacterium]|nr:NAD(P)/FAD-dependent oxidoreductase [Anaerolineae bacterium]
MGDRSVIIIGAGLAGLAAGCYAQMNGYRSQIVEHHSQPGGVAAWWRRKGYLIDGGIHFLMGHKPGTGLYDLYQTVGIVPGVPVVDFDTFGRYVHEPSGRSVVITPDLNRLAVDLKALSPADARLVDELIAGAKAMQGMDMSTVGMARPPELTGPFAQLGDLWAMRGMLRYFTGKFGQTMHKYVREAHDPTLAMFLELFFMPEVPVYFVMMLLALLADEQLGLLAGGCRDLVRAMEQRYLDLGGEVTYRAAVREILVESDRAVGVRLVDGAPAPLERRAGAVISAADGRSTIYDLLGGRYVDAAIDKRYATWPRFRPLLMISYGVARDFTGEPPFTTLVLDEPLQVTGQDLGTIMVRTFGYSDRFAPAGKGVIQVEFETEWDFWHDLRCADKARYEAEKARVAGEALRRLERVHPGLGAQVEVTDVSTPYTTWRYTLNDRGSWEGWLLTAEAMRTAVKRTLPGLADFYMAGQWVMPGGGVPPVLYSGQHAVQLLCRRDGKRFVA